MTADEQQQEEQGDAPAGEAESVHDDQTVVLPEVSLLRHVFDIAQQVTIALGEAENPITGKREKSLPAARYLIDILVMLEEKTKGNRSEEEETYLTGVVTNLKLAYVNKSK